MFGLGLFEIAIIVLALIILIKPDDYPRFFRKCGEYVRKYKQAMSVIQNEIQEITDLDNPHLDNPRKNH